MFGNYTPIQFKLIDILERKGGKNRDELVALLKTPRTTIYDNLIKLEKKGIVDVIEKHNGKRGRPIKFWKIKYN